MHERVSNGIIDMKKFHIPKKRIFMKYTIGIILSVAAGFFTGFFGALVSVMADGGLSERLTVIIIVLFIYCFISAVPGFFLPGYSWKWGLLIGVPGVLLLGNYTRTEFNIYYFIYMIAIICFSCVGAWGGSRIRDRVKRL